MTPKKLLLVEDNTINIEIMANLLDGLEIAHDIAMNGQEAVEACIREGRQFYRLILMDVHMPVLDGYEASRILKEEIGVTAPIILCTATMFSEAVFRKYEKYVDGVILKPFESNEFCRMIRPYFDARRPMANI